MPPCRKSSDASVPAIFSGSATVGDFASCLEYLPAGALIWGVLSLPSIREFSRSVGSIGGGVSCGCGFKNGSWVLVMALVEDKTPKSADPLGPTSRGLDTLKTLLLENNSTTCLTSRTLLTNFGIEMSCKLFVYLCSRAEGETYWAIDVLGEGDGMVGELGGR
ncbi:hypothetical protein CDL15_Pgr023800 [Punica granatum]|uniref:Uncharacterized protein n=1 Tax=Punica granatum TaxID=22663 RepID=A0A218VZR1_PUNGR|nr:hypothetical protein CDL15_Pgr023800 [Punica granatum]